MLQPGDVWGLCNGLNSTRNKVCDFTGTVLFSDKNFAMISWTQRTGFPVGAPSNRDPLSQQLLPVDKWGKKHITEMLLGEFNKYSQWKTGSWIDENPGQYYRVVAKEDNTTCTATWYDLLSYNQIGRWTTVLDGEGEWDQYLLPSQYSAGLAPQHSITGTCYWESDRRRPGRHLL